MTRKQDLIILFSIFVSGCTGVASLLPPNDPLERLKYDIDTVLLDSIFIPSRASIKVVSLETHETLYERDAKLLFRPASNIKLLTSAAGIHYLGPGFLFKTSVHADSISPDGILTGDIYLKGSGDPDLRTSHLDSLARILRASGLNSITGDVVGDVSYFDDLYWGNGWMWDDEPGSDEMFITPLSVNSNCVKVRVEPGIWAGDSALVSIEPQTEYVMPINFAKTVTDTIVQPLKVTRLFKQRSNIIIVEGEILAGSTPREEQLSVWKPELYAVQLFKEALMRSGVPVRGRARIGTVSAHASELTHHERRFDSIVVNLNKVSDNLSAENTLKTLAAVKRGIPGKAVNGIYVVNEFLSTLGIDTTAYLMADGSGVSHYNLLTTEMLIQLLAAVYNRPDLFPLFYESLPIAGVDGTIRGRMKAMAAEGNVRAKTGTISGVSSLSGYVKSRENEMLAFSIMMQNFIKPNRLYREAQDRIANLLARFSRRRVESAAVN